MKKITIEVLEQILSITGGGSYMHVEGPDLNAPEDLRSDSTIANMDGTWRLDEIVVKLNEYLELS